METAKKETDPARIVQLKPASTQLLYTFCLRLAVISNQRSSLEFVRELHTCTQPGSIPTSNRHARELSSKEHMDGVTIAFNEMTSQKRPK